jgi:hypothetical protein
MVNRRFDAPPGTKPIDQYGLNHGQIERIKQNADQGPRDWTGISRDGHVIVSDEEGNPVDLGTWEELAK